MSKIEGKYVVGYTFSGPYKVDLPEDILQKIVDSPESLSASPLIFRLEHGEHVKHVGVREFSAPASQIGLNEHLAEFLDLNIGDAVELARVELPKGTQITLKINEEHKTEPIDWKSLLEAWIPKHYTVLSLGDRLSIPYLGVCHELTVTNLEPSHESVCILDTDMELIIESSAAVKPELSTQDPAQDLELVLNKPIDLLMPTTLTCSVPSGVDALYFSCTGIAYIGPEHATSPTSFVSTADATPVRVSTALLGSAFSVVASGTLTVNTELHDENTGKTSDVSGQKVCEFCRKQIPEQSFVLHTTFCSRNSCRCPHCETAFSGTVSVPENHLLRHGLEADGSGGACECGEFAASTAAQLAFHRATVCSLKLHICQFCHLLVPLGETSPIDLALGLSGHEAQCGNRTTDCPLCNKPIRLRSLALHLSDHDHKRKQRQPPPMCSNQNCPNPLGRDAAPMQLCASCFGPLSVPGSNTDLGRVRQRIERRYILQMTRGCGKTWCMNAYCAMNQKRSASDAMQLVKQIMQDGNGEHWFCVDEPQTRKAMFVQLDDEYARGWRGAAMSQCATESEARVWLQNNANKLNE